MILVISNEHSVVQKIQSLNGPGNVTTMNTNSSGLIFQFFLVLSESVSWGSGGGGTVGELAPSLLTAPCRKELLMLAGDVESNPGPYTNYGEYQLNTMTFNP